MITLSGININQYIPSFKANPMPQNQASYIDKRLRDADSVDIFCHASTDEDAFNSAKAMYLYLEQLGKKPRIIASNNPDLYNFDRQKYNITLAKELSHSTKNADLALCVDFSKKERLSAKALEYLEKFPEDRIVGFDHHSESEFLIKDTNRITKKYDSIKNMPELEPSNYYIDSTSKSCSAVIFRFFEALGAKMTKQQLSSIFCGMVDDIQKFDIVNSKKRPDDTYECKLTENKNLDKNTKEVFTKVSSSLTDFRKNEILEHLDILGNLSDEENAFMKKLFDGVKFSENGKFAYCIIDVNDEDWIKFGGDTNRTSAMIRDFRMRLIKNKFKDPLISKPLRENLKNIKAAGIFYPDYDEEIYKVSLHSKKDYVSRYQDYIKKNIYPGLTAGGHSNRGGGRILTLDEDKCNEWASYFVRAAQAVNYD